MSRPRKKSYDAEAVMQELMATVDECYKEHGQIKAVAKELDLAELKVKKLLITSKRISYPQTDAIQRLLRSGASMNEVMDSLCLSRSSINAYLPYSKVPYKESEISANADRCELYRKRRAAISSLSRTTVDMERLWSCIILFAGYPFKTSTGLKFTYKIGRDGKEAVLKVAMDENVDGVLAYASDPAAPTAAYVAEKMGKSYPLLADKEDEMSVQETLQREKNKGHWN